MNVQVKRNFEHSSGSSWYIPGPFTWMFVSSLIISKSTDQINRTSMFVIYLIFNRWLLSSQASVATINLHKNISNHKWRKTIIFLRTYISTPYRSLHQGTLQLPCTRHTIFTSLTQIKHPRARALSNKPFYYIKVSGIASGNKLIKAIRYPHMWRYDIFTCEDIDDFGDIKFVS